MDNVNVAIAEEINRQIGHQAFVMMGASNKVAIERGLTFKIGRNAKKVTHIRITLDPSDTYNVEFLRVTPIRVNRKTFTTTGGETKTIADFVNIYVDQLHKLIESNTGLYLSL